MVRILPSLVSTLSEKFYCKAVLNIANKLKLNKVFLLMVAEKCQKISVSLIARRNIVKAVGRSSDDM